MYIFAGYLQLRLMVLNSEQCLINRNTNIKKVRVLATCTIIRNSMRLKKKLIV